MNNISDKTAILIILLTVLIVFLLIFSVRSPERKVIDSPLMWKEDFTDISNTVSDRQDFNFYQ